MILFLLEILKEKLISPQYGGLVVKVESMFSFRREWTGSKIALRILTVSIWLPVRKEIVIFISLIRVTPPASGMYAQFVIS